jgi:hypothetical protein
LKQSLRKAADASVRRALDAIRAKPLSIDRLEAPISRWNAVIPKCALDAETGPTHTTYLHPRKGFRRVSNKRLVVRGALANTAMAAAL